MSASRVRYVCLKCRREFDKQQLDVMMAIRCPYCGFRAIAKTRGGIVKIVKAI